MLSIVGDDSAAESDASSVSDYDATSDPMDRFSVTGLPATALPGTALLAPHPQASQPGPSSAWHQSQQQVAMQLPYASDDSAHDPRNLGGRLTSGVGEEEAEGSAVRPDLAALRGRDDSARDMPVLMYICTILHALFALQWQSSLQQKPKRILINCDACESATAPVTQAHENTPQDKGTRGIGPHTCSLQAHTSS